MDKAGRGTVRPQRSTGGNQRQRVSDATPRPLPAQAGRFGTRVPFALHSHSNPAMFLGEKSSNGSNLFKVTEPVRSTITVLSP